MKTRGCVALALAGMLGLGFYSWTQTAPAVAAEESDKPTSAKIGENAPDFKLKDAYGKEFTLAEFKGKIVVLEWLSGKCPVSHAAHEKKQMQDTYKRFAENVVWLGVHTGEAAANDERVYAAEMEIAYPILLDKDGKVGRAYAAKTTPHLFVIDKAGKLAYDGAIDDKGSTNYVAEAVGALIDGKKVAKSKTQPYGCGVKYPRG